MYALEEFWRGAITPSERGYRKDKAFAELVEKATEFERIFYEELSPRGKKAFEDYCDIQDQMEDAADLDTFIRSFRLGARMILDVIGSYDSPMIQINEIG